MDADEGLALTTKLLEAADASANGGAQIDTASVQSSMRRLTKLFQSAARQKSVEKARSVAQLDTLRAEMHTELVDREANAARVAERQRFLFERHAAQHGQASAADRAGQSAAFVEAALVSLCPHATTHSPGCAQLATEDR